MKKRPLRKHALGSEALLDWQVSCDFSLLETDSKSAAVELWDPDFAVMDRNDVGLVAIEAHLVSSRSEKNAQDYIHLSPGKTGVLILAICHKQEINIIGRNHTSDPDNFAIPSRTELNSYLREDRHRQSTGRD